MVREIQIDLTSKVKIDKLQPRININTFIQDGWSCETKTYQGCRDWDFLRLWNIWVVETETLWDYEMSGLSRLRLFETEKFEGCRDWDWPRLIKSCRDRDFSESLADLCCIKHISCLECHSVERDSDCTYVGETRHSAYEKTGTCGGLQE